MSPAADRNLLFGILALQMDFITREQLVAAMNAWVLDKSTALGMVMVRQGALTRANHDLLAPLVEAHIRQHNNDPQQSLAALGSASSARRDLQQVADADVQASLAMVSVGHRDDDSHLTRSFSVGEASSVGTRFRILRPHAEGGLGKVSVALDEELRREVALKEIKEKHADDPGSRGRFLLEAEITGGLEHPGIVPVYGLGTYADGRPFYAMRFIKGDSLKEAIDRFHKNRTTDHTDNTDQRKDKSVQSVKSVVDFSGLEFRKLLARFIDVCNAIAYAHSRGVLHRDLKPGNIMLGKYGETLVVDWGLAKVGVRNQGADQPEAPARAGVAATTIDDEQSLKPSGSDYVETVAGSTVGTPAFMSPEQAAGRLDLLGPTSDVYSLGATLYAILTGRPPIEKMATPDVLRRVQKGEFAPPRQVCPEMPAPLEAVCRKAMSLEPADRYATPRDLADDVEQWLADEPVKACEEPWVIRTRRWGRKHRALVTGFATTAIVGALGLGAFTLFLAAANDQLRTANQNEKKAKTEAFEMQKNAEKEAENTLAALKDREAALRERDGILNRLLHLENVYDPEIDKQRNLFVQRIDEGKKRFSAFTEQYKDWDKWMPEKRKRVFEEENPNLDPVIRGIFSTELENVLIAKDQSEFKENTCGKCHASGFPAAAGDGIEFNEYDIWRKMDRHSKAYNTLRGPRATEILKRLLGIERLPDDPFEIRFCLVCHSPSKAASFDEPLRAKFRRVDPTEGVSCEDCHGNADKWLLDHAFKQASWRTRTAKEKEIFGMINLRNPTQKSAVCLSCHLGEPAAGKVVTHEMIASGHPPLIGFETVSFSDKMARHWRLPSERKTQDKEGEEPLVSAIISNTVALEFWTELYKSGRNPWADKDSDKDSGAGFLDCASCHHSYRMTLGAPAYQRSSDGSPRPPRWIMENHDAFVRFLVKEGVLTEVEQQPFADLKVLLQHGIGKGHQDRAMLDQVLSRSRLHLHNMQEALGKARLRGRKAGVIQELLANVKQREIDFDSARHLVLLLWAVSSDRDEPHSERRKRAEEFDRLYREFRLGLNVKDRLSWEVDLFLDISARRLYEPIRGRQTLIKLCEMLLRK